MFDPFAPITDHINAMRPVAQSAADQAARWGERVIARLDAIHDALVAEEFDDLVRTFAGNLDRTGTNFPDPGAFIDLLTVPAGSRVIVEHWFGDNLTATNTNMGLNIDGRRAANILVSGSGRTQGPATGLVVKANQTLTLEVATAAASIGYYVQVRQERVKAARIHPHTGQIMDPRAEPGITPPNPEMFRHTGTAITRR